MLNDIFTILWKEFSETMKNRQGIRGGWTSYLLIIAVMGIFIPWQMGKTWLSDPRQLLYWSWMPILLALSQVTDSFAGERERRTLETLLSTRLSDQAILFGKLLAVVLYAWSMTLGSLVIGAVTINVAYPTGTIQFYPALNFITGLLISFLAALLISSIGVLVSLKSSSVRQAYQRMSLVMIGLWFLPMLALQIIPDNVKEKLAVALSNLDLTSVVQWGIVILVVLDVLLVWVNQRVFCRSRLLLDRK